MLKSEKYFMLEFVHFPFASLRKTISRQGVKVVLDSRNDNQSPIDKLVSGRRYKNPAKSICTSTYYSQKKPKRVDVFSCQRNFFLWASHGGAEAEGEARLSRSRPRPSLIFKL